MLKTVADLFLIAGTNAKKDYPTWSVGIWTILYALHKAKILKKEINNDENNKKSRNYSFAWRRL